MQVPTSWKTKVVFYVILRAESESGCRISHVRL